MQNKFAVVALILFTCPIHSIVAQEEPAASWTGRAEFGLDGQTGNSERLSLKGLVQTTRATDFARLSLYLRGQFEETSGERSKNEIIAGTKYERDLSERTFAFLHIEMERDEFESLDLRSTLTVGIGYFLIRAETHELKIRAGPSYQHEELDDGSTTDNLLAGLGYDYRLDLNERIRFTSTLSYFFNATEMDDWRLTAENAAEIPISTDAAWKLRLGIRNAYDALPQPGVERLDTSYFTSLTYDW